MGIYSNDLIYGVRMYKFIYNDKSNNYEYCELFSIMYDKIITQKKLDGVKKIYDNLNEEDKIDIKFSIYTECTSTYKEGTSTYKEGTFMMCNEISQTVFFKLFQKIDYLL